MKKHFLLAILMLLPLLASAADKVEINGIYYYLTSGETNTASVTSKPSGKYSGEVIIPESVTYEDITYNVTSIGVLAFSNCKGLISVTIPNSVRSIGSHAFLDCSSLTSITISNSLTSIGEFSFSGCSSLTSITIPSGVTHIGECAFAGCSTLTAVHITDLAAWCKLSFKDKDYNPLSVAHHLFLNGEEIKDLVIPDGITKINSCLFEGATEFKTVSIPNSVTSIGYRAFLGCSSLTSVTIPNSVTSIGDLAFCACSSLSSVVMGSAVTSISYYSFRNTDIKKTIWLANTPPTGASYAEGKINYVSNDQYNISNKVVYPFLNSYFEVDGIRYVPVSTSQKTCDAIDCVYDESAKTIKIPSTVTYKEIDMNVNNVMDYIGYGNTYIENLTLENYGGIRAFSFANCSKMKTINLGERVSSIGPHSFEGCTAVSEITTKAIIPPTCGAQALDDIYKWKCKLYVPKGYLAAYQVAEQWMEFFFTQESETEAIPIGKSGKASYCGDKSLDFSFSDEIKAYIATGFDKDAEIIWLTRVKDVPAGVPVLIKGVAEKTYQVPVTDSQNSYYTNMFKGNTSGDKIQVPETENGFVNYYLSGDGTFKSVKNYANIGNNKSYLQLPGTFNPATAGETQKVTVGSSGKASYAAPVDLDFTNVEGLKAFTATGYDKSSKTIWLTRVMKVQKGEGLLLKGEAKEYQIPSVAVQSSYGNMFVGNTSGNEIQVKDTSDDGSLTNFYLKADGTFVSVNNYVNIKNNKCYLALPTSMVSPAASTRGEASYLLDEPEVIKLPILFRSLDNDGNGTTAIKEVKSGEVKGEKWFTLQGQRVVNPGKGVYIKDGKKIIIK